MLIGRDVTTAAGSCLMGLGVVTQVISPVPHALWKEVFDSDPNALPFQGPRWMLGIANTRRFTDESLLFVTPTCRIILPLAGYRVAPLVDGAASLPRGYGVGGLISDHELTPSSVKAVVENLARSRFSRISVRPNPVSLGYEALERHRWRANARAAHVLCLGGGLPAVLERMQARKRTSIRRLLRSDLELESGNSRRLIDAYYDIYMRWCESRGRELGVASHLARWFGRRLEPYSKFVHTAAAMRDELRFYVAWVHGRAVAASILVLSKRSAAYWRGASDLRSADDAGANDFLQIRMIDDACASGCAFYHMGESGGLPGLIAFKERLGARRYDYREYILESAPLASVSKVVGHGHDRVTALLRRSRRSGPG